MKRVVVGAVAAGGLEVDTERVVVGGTAAAAAVVEEDGCGLVGGEACVRGAHGGFDVAATFDRLSGRFALSLACLLAR